MTLRSALNEFNSQAGPLKALFTAVAEIEQHYQQADELAALDAQLEQVRTDLINERDMLASASNDLTETLQKLQRLEREAANVLGNAQSRADEILIEAKAQSDTLVREATLEARRKQTAAEQDLDAVCTRLAAAKQELAGLERQVRLAQDAAPVGDVAPPEHESLSDTAA